MNFKKIKKKEIEIVFQDGFPLINVKAEWKEAIDEIEDNLKAYKKISRIAHISEGFIYGILFSLFINIIIFLFILGGS